MPVTRSRVAAEAVARRLQVFMLPIELLVEIFLYITADEAARAALVCQTWHAASQDARIWRHLSFTPAKHRYYDLRPPFSPLEVGRQQQLKSIGARCGDTVMSFDFGNLAGAHVEVLAKGLEASLPSLKHIHWSKVRHQAWGHTVVSLAKRCPRLEIVELCIRGTLSIEILASETPCHARPHQPHGRQQRAVKTLRGLAQRPSCAIRSCHLAGLDQPDQRSSGDLISLNLLTRLFRNQRIEQLTVHGAWLGDSPFPCSLSAPSLTSLVLRSSESLHGSL